MFYKAWLKKAGVATLIVAVMVSFCPSDMSYASKTSQKLNSVSREKQKVSNSLDVLNGKIERQENEINGIRKSIKNKNSDIRKASSDYNKTKGKLKGTIEKLELRVRAMYKTGSVGYIDILFGSKNVSELIDNVEFVQKIYKNDQKAVKDLEKHKKTIKDKKKRLNSEKKDLKNVKDKLDAKQEDLNRDKRELKRKLDKLQAEEARLQKKIDKIQAAKRIKVTGGGMVAPASAGSSGDTVKLPSNYSGGKFIWPVHGPITAPFGQKRSYERHPGVDIGVPTGTPVHAAASGVVICASYMTGYGNVVIIDHGSGLITKYGHNSRFAIKAGARVKQGQVVAYAGSTGWSTGPHCHFEVRKNGVAVNPSNYL